MLKKLTALIAILAILSFASVGFTGEQIFDIIEDTEPKVRFETAERFSQIFGG